MGKRAASVPQAWVCRGGKCRKAGADELLEGLARELEGRAACVGVTGCLDRCKKGVAALLWPEGVQVAKLKPKHAEALAEHLTEGSRLPKKVEVRAGKKTRKKAAKRAGRSDEGPGRSAA